MSDKLDIFEKFWSKLTFLGLSPGDTRLRCKLTVWVGRARD